MSEEFIADVSDADSVKLYGGPNNSELEEVLESTGIVYVDEFLEEENSTTPQTTLIEIHYNSAISEQFRENRIISKAIREIVGEERYDEIEEMVEREL